MSKHAVFVAAALTASVASAQFESIRQRFILNEPLIAPLAAIDFFAQVDVTTITGTGSESAVITVASIRLLQRPDEASPFVITAAGELDTPPNPYIDEPLNLRAEFLNGVFTDNVSVIDNPNSGNLSLIEVRNATGFAGFFNVSGFDVIYGPTILDLQSYRRESSTITPAAPSASLVALGGVFAIRRKRG